ncbi:hypothetical protein [Gynuella sp.]
MLPNSSRFSTRQNAILPTGITAPQDMFACYDCQAGIDQAVPERYR